MWKISEIVSLGILSTLAVSDIRKREIPVYAVWCSGILSAIYYLTGERKSMWLLAGGVLVGICFLIISRITREGIGYGDSLAILVLGSFLGFWNILTVMAFTFFLMLCVLIPVLWKKKMSRTYTLPFLPFLAAGYLCFLIAGGGVN